MAEKFVFDVALRGGGIKGAAFVGAFEKLLGDGHDTRCLIGTSAGAIFATFAAAGYTPDEMRAAVVPATGPSAFKPFLGRPEKGRMPRAANERSWHWWFDKSGFADDSTAVEHAAGAYELALKTKLRLRNPLKPLTDDEQAELSESRQAVIKVRANIASSFAAGAFYADHAFEAWMGERLNQKGFGPATTLKEFDAAVNEKRRADNRPACQLSLIATDTTEPQVLVLNHRTAPDLPVYQAVRMSMSVPFVWPEVVWQFGRYRGQPLDGHRIVDGGVLANFPLRFITEERHRDPEKGVLGPLPDAGKPLRSLGMFLDATKTVPSAPNRDPKKNLGILQKVPAYDLATRLLDTMTGASEQELLGQYQSMICRIGTKGFDALDFSLSGEELGWLINSGNCAMAEYLTQLR